MFSLVLNGLMLLVIIWAWQRRRTHKWLAKRWDEERLTRWISKEFKIIQRLLIMIILISSYRFVVYRPEGMPLWFPLSILGTLLLLIAGHHYFGVVQRIWVLMKEPFKKLDKRDLKWRMKMRLSHVTNELKFVHKRTWTIMVMTGRLLVCKVFKHRWKDWETAKYVSNKKTRRCKVCQVVHSKEGQDESYHDGHFSSWPKIRDSYAVFNREVKGE